MFEPGSKSGQNPDMYSKCINIKIHRQLVTLANCQKVIVSLTLRKALSVHIYYTGVTSFKFFQTVYRRTRHEPSSSVQFENYNDVTPSVINMNR